MIYLKWWKGRTYPKNTLPRKTLLHIWWRNQKFSRQAKVKRIQHHQTSFTRNAKGTSLGRKQEERKASATENKPKQLRKMVIGSYISIIALNVNGLNAPTKRHRLAERMKKCVCMLFHLPHYSAWLAPPPPSKLYVIILACICNYLSFLSGCWLGKLINIFYYSNYATITHLIPLYHDWSIEKWSCSILPKPGSNRKTYNHKIQMHIRIILNFFENYKSSGIAFFLQSSRYVSNEQPFLKTTGLYDDPLLLVCFTFSISY